MFGVPAKGSVEQEDLEKQLKKEFLKLEINPLFLDWSLAYLDKKQIENKGADKIIIENQTDKITNLENEKNELIKMRAKKLIDDITFSNQLADLEKEIASLKNNGQNKKQKSPGELLELTKNSFIFCAHAKKEFEKGDKHTRKEILTELGSNRAIINKNLNISYYEWLIPIRNNAQKFNAELARLEPAYFGEYQRKNEALTSLNLRWLAWRDGFRMWVAKIK